jgi:hypothetical protein
VNAIRTPTRYLLSAAMLFIFCTPGVFGQTRPAPLEPALMPANTTFYFIWRGQPSAELRKSNSIAALWDDPGFAPVRSSITNALLKGSQDKSADLKTTDNKSSAPRLTREQIEEYASLLENPFVLGYISDSRKRPAGASAAEPAADKAPPWNGIFFVYDRTGKEAILAKAVLSLRSSEKEVPTISQITVADIPTLKVQRTSGVTYWVENGKYAVSANELPVLEAVLHRLNGKAAVSGSLADLASYKEAHAMLGSGQLEFFLRVPELKSFVSNASPGGLQVSPVLEAMKLDAIQSISGRVLLEGSKTRVQAAVLGDTAPGSLFDIWGPGASAPAGLSVASADVISYSDVQVNLPGLYAFVKRVATSLMPPGKQGSVDMIEMMAQAQLGQSLISAIELFTGEFVTLQSNTALDNDQQVYLIGIRNPADTVKLMHKILGERIASERTEGATTFLKISTGGKQTSAGSAGWDFYHVAATPDYLVVGSKLESVRALLASRSQSSAANLSSAPGFQAARKQFPATVNGMGYFDFRKVDWPAVKARLIAKANKPARRAPGAPKAAESGSPVPSWMLNVNPDVFGRHLHVASSASWKDAQGLHFDEWIE